MHFRTALIRNEPLLISSQELIAFVDQTANFKEFIEELYGKNPEPYEHGNNLIVPIKGMIGKGLAPVEKLFGGFDLDDLEKTLEKANKYDAVIFYHNSPGGTVTGVPEMAERIRSLSTRTIAFTDSLMASASYWLGSAADELIVTPSANVGSIGVYTVFPDYSKMLNKSGITVEVIKAGEEKGAGIYGTSLTDKQRESIQNQVTEIHAEFKNSVMKKRLFANIDDMEGQIFSGRQAATNNLATGIVGSFNELLKRFG
jgi:signal peptide peptidase SppA